MAGELNITQVRQYNASLQEYKDKAAKLNAEIEVNTAELDRLCKELSATLGMTVTPENVEEIYNKKVAEINDAVATGMDIMRRIKEEETLQASAPTASKGTVVLGGGNGATAAATPAPTPMAATQAAPAAPVSWAAPPVQAPTPPVAPVTPGAGTQFTGFDSIGGGESNPAIFGGQQGQIPVVPQVAPMFSQDGDIMAMP